MHPIKAEEEEEEDRCKVVEEVCVREREMI